MSKSKKARRRLTAQRKVFLEAVKILAPFFCENGYLSPESNTADDVSCRLLRLRDALRSDMNRIGVCEFASAVCSALFFMHSGQIIEDIDDQSEESVGGEVFEVAFNLGWSMGFDCGKDVASEKD
jgi:hypothetical protein